MSTNWNILSGIRLRVILSLSILLLLFSIAFFVFQSLIKKQNNLNETHQKNELTESVNAILKVKHEHIEKLTYDYGCYDWMVKFVTNTKQNEALQYIGSPDGLGIDYFSVYNLNKQNIYLVQSKKFNNIEINISDKVYENLYSSRYVNFFLPSSKGIIEISGTTIHPSADFNKQTAPQGYIFIGKIIDSTYIANIQKALKTKIQLERLPYPISDTSTQLLRIPLLSPDNKTIAYINIYQENKYSESIDEYNKYLKLFFIIICVILLVTTIYTYNAFVLKPLTYIESTLNTNSTEEIQTLAEQNTEFGHISKLIVQFFNQKDMLNNKIQELGNAQEELSTLNDELQVQKEELLSTAENLFQANESVHIQKSAIEEKNKEITDSIKYASIIQNAVLIPSINFSNYFPEHFVFYKPKNIVSGDFYWFKDYNGKCYFAGADCTGHGLSGSLMTMLGISLLNEIVSKPENQNLQASEILNLLRNSIVDSLHQTGDIGEIHDGIDIVFGIFDKANLQVQFAAAYNPLYHVSINDQMDAILTDYKGDPMPVGIYEKTNGFTNHVLQVKKGDIIYIFSDGFPDQFGGTQGKKLRAKNFKQLLVSLYNYPLESQKELIGGFFDDWKGSHEQTDDVMVIGFKI